MRTETRLLRTSRWIDECKPQCKRINPEQGRMEIDSILYTRLCMLQDQIGALLVKIDKAKPRRRFDYK